MTIAATTLGQTSVANLCIALCALSGVGSRNLKVLPRRFGDVRSWHNPAALAIGQPVRLLG
jgi:hypothetical protein